MNTPQPERANEVVRFYPPQRDLPIQLHKGSSVSIHLNTTNKPQFLQVYFDGENVRVVDGAGTDVFNQGIPLASLPLQFPIGRGNMAGMYHDATSVHTATRVSRDQCVLELGFDHQDNVPTVRFESANGRNGTVYRITENELLEDRINDCRQNLVPIMSPGVSREFRLEGPQREGGQPQYSREGVIVKNMLGKHLVELTVMNQRLYVYNNATKESSPVPHGPSLEIKFENGDSLKLRILAAGTSSYGRERNPEGVYNQVEVTNTGDSSVYGITEQVAFTSDQS